jgi:hypothetical protein
MILQQKIEDLFSLKIGISMKDSGKIIKEMEKVCRYGKMALFIKDTGKIILLMVLVDLSIPMVMYI